MKMLLIASAMMIAAPAFAQNAAPAHDHHGAHGAAPAGHQGHGTPAKDPHAGHKMDGECCLKTADGKMRPCCEKMQASGKPMACCEKATDAHKGHGKDK